MSPRTLLLGAALLVLTTSGCRRSPASADTGVKVPPASTSTAQHYRKRYEFTYDWFTNNVPHWRKVLGPFAGRAKLRYLEIGVFEGRSALWALENIVTHPSSELWVIDPFLDPASKTRWLKNVQISGQAVRIRTLAGFSQRELRKLELDSYDIVYVDGSHTADDVLADAILAWPLLREGGVMIFDDFRWSGIWPADDGRVLPVDLRPNFAILAFVTAYRNALEVVHQGYQLMLKKRPHACARHKDECSPIGPYRYYWLQKKLVKVSGEAETPVPLTDAERRIIEAIAHTKGVGQVQFHLTHKLATDPAFIALRRRLGLDLDPKPIPH